MGLRKRVLHPDFWTDKSIVQLKYETRLLYAGLWCYADDEGYFILDPYHIKLTLFPDQPFPIDESLVELLTAKSDGGGFFSLYKCLEFRQIACFIRSWERYRPKYAARSAISSKCLEFKDKNDLGEFILNCPKLGQFGKSLTCSFSNVPIPLILSSSLGIKKRRLRVEEGGELELDTSPDGMSQLSRLWNINCPLMSKVIEMSDKRRAKEAVRIRERPIEQWAQIFRKINDSDFCRGKNDREWWASYDWVMENKENGIKVLEGKYDNKKRRDGSPWDNKL